jgi:hypothetical protein
MRRSCLVGLILVAAVLLAASFWLRRYLTPETEGAASPTSTAIAGASDAAPPALLPTLPQPTSAPVLAEDRVYEERIQGLYLEAVQPLAEAEMDIRGLAAAEGKLYVTVYDAAGQTAWLHELDRSSASTLRSLPLGGQGPGEPCGLQAAGQLLWTCVNSQDGALILAVDRAAWAAAAWAPVTDTLRAVAQTADGSVVGVDRAGERFYHWGVDGVLQRVAINATGVVYADCELIRGSLVCVGAEQTGGVMDVLDPESLSLLARRQASTRTAWGALVAGNALAYDGEWFLLAPSGGQLPLVWSYRLDGGSLADYVPSVRPPQ